MNKEIFKTYPRHWIASDIHFSHLNILKYEPETRGKFENVEQMNEVIIARWNSYVHPDDHTFILGDVAMGNISLAPSSIKRLNGHKTLIRGNHDRTLMKLPEVNDLFIDIRDYLCMSAYGTGLVMSHFPFASWDGKKPTTQSTIHFHGHLHGSPSGVKGWIHDVGIDTNNLYPYDLKNLITDIKQNKPLCDVNHHGQ